MAELAIAAIDRYTALAVLADNAETSHAKCWHIPDLAFSFTEVAIVDGTLNPRRLHVEGLSQVHAVIIFDVLIRSGD
jgi:hypothetical protein